MDRPASPGSRADDRNPRRSWPTGRRSSIREWWSRASRSWTCETAGEGGAGRSRKRRVPLVELAHARSGDKGDTANVGLIALKPEYYPILVQHVTAARVARHFKGMISGPVERYELPNLHALNFLLHGALDGGGTISLKTDAQGKVFSTALLRLELELPK